jgi:titin
MKKRLLIVALAAAISLALVAQASAATFFLYPPDAPSDLTVDSTTLTSITISWTDNSSDEQGFQIERREEGGTFAQVGYVEADTTEYLDTGLEAGTTYHYRVRAVNAHGNSDYTNEATGTTLDVVPPEAPANLEATAVSSSQINLSWDGVDYTTGYKLERKGGGDWALLTMLGASATTFADTGLDPGTSFQYRVQARNMFGDSDYSNVAEATTQAEAPPPAPPPVETTTIRFYIDNQTYYVNDVEEYMDTTPVILNERTLLPIRYVAQPLGAEPMWNSAEQKVTVTMGSTVIEMWIGNNEARINGVSTQIDPDNPGVTPIILDGRTMVPMRFAAENLGASVSWNGAIQEVEIVHPAEL